MRQPLRIGSRSTKCCLLLQGTNRSRVKFRQPISFTGTQADPRFIPSLLDAPHRDGTEATRPNYTVETLTRLRASLVAEAQPTELFTLLGADSWLEIGQWFHASRLLALTNWIVAARPGFAFVRVAAAAHGGAATAESNAGGARFTLSLPAAQGV